MLGVKLLLNDALKYAKVVNKDIKLAYKQYPTEIYGGWKRGKRLAQQKDLDTFSTIALSSKSAARKAKIQPEYIPGLLAGITTLIPFPLTSMGGYLVGKGLKNLIKIK